MTPLVIDSGCGARSELRKMADNRMVSLQDQTADLAVINGLPVTETIANDYQRLSATLLPTPTVSDTFTGNLKSTQHSEGSLHSVTLAQVVNRPDLLPTPMTTDYKQTDCAGNWNRHSPPLGTIVHSTNWGRFEPAIKRWEQVTGTPAPAPTLPDGKDGTHRLSPLFGEWLMGLKPGHLTGLGLSRKDELKACGNGVVPQQAALALSLLDPEPNI